MPSTHGQMADISNHLMTDGDSADSRRISEGSQDSYTSVTQRTFSEGSSRRKRTSSECSPRVHSSYPSAPISTAFGASELSQDGFSEAAAINFANTESEVPQFGQMQTLDSSGPLFPTPLETSAVFAQLGENPPSGNQETSPAVAVGASTPAPTDHRGRAASLESSFSSTGSYPEAPSTLTKQANRLGALLHLDSARKDQPAFKRSRRHWMARSSNLPPITGPAAAAASIASSAANAPLAAAAAEVVPASVGRHAKQIANTPVPNRRASHSTDSSGLLRRSASRRLSSTPASTVGQRTPCGRTPMGNTTPVPSKILKPHVERRPAKPGLRLRRFNSLNAGTSRVETEHDLDVALLQPMELMGDGESTRLIRAMMQRQVRMICVDFDKTFVKVHTRSRWDPSNVDQLKCKVRPAIRALMLSWLSAGMVVSVVTFSSQHELIEAVVRSVFPARFHSSIVVVSSDSSFRATVEANADSLNKFLASRTNIPAHVIQSGRDLGKMRHIWVAIQRFSSAPINCTPPFGPSHCILIDDCRENIDVCRKFTAVKSFHLVEENKSALFDSMREEFLGGPPASESSVGSIALSDSGGGGGGAEFSPGLLATAPLERASTFPLPHSKS